MSWMNSLTSVERDLLNRIIPEEYTLKLIECNFKKYLEEYLQSSISDAFFFELKGEDSTFGYFGYVVLERVPCFSKGEKYLRIYSFFIFLTEELHLTGNCMLCDYKGVRKDKIAIVELALRVANRKFLLSSSFKVLQKINPLFLLKARDAPVQSFFVVSPCPDDENQ